MTAPYDLEPAGRVGVRPTGAANRAGNQRTAVRHGTADGVEVWYDSELGTAGREVAAAVLGRIEPDLATISRLFGGVRPAASPVRVTLLAAPRGRRAFHDSADRSRVYCDVAMTPALRPRYSNFLVAIELAELTADAHAQGWQPGSAQAAALARVIATSIYPRQLTGFATAAAWLDSDRVDHVSSPAAADDAAIGCCVLFLHYLHGELGFSWPEIIAAGGPTLAVTYRRLTGELDEPFAAFADGLARAFPPGAAARLAVDNPYPLADATTDPLADATTDPAPDPGPLVLSGAGPVTAVDRAVRAPAETPAAVPRLADALAHRRWWVCDAPFRHLRADDVFTPDVYGLLEAEFNRRLARGDLTRSLPGYDASAACVTPENAGALAIFLGREWHDVVAGALGVRASGTLNVTLHHHAPGSLSGRPHNDLNPGWFPDRPAGPDTTTVHDPAICNYQTGESKTGEPTVEHVRAIALLYYLATPDGVRGGQTGLYRSAHDDVARPDVAVAPRNNSLVAFECTPYSFHSFMTNTVQPRNSVVMWLHRPIAEAIEQWGESSIVRWKR